MVPESEGPGGPLAPPIFGRSVNPISTREGILSPTIATGPPNIFHLPASLYLIVTYSDFQYPDFTWERQTQGVILGAFFYGYIFTQIPGGYLATKFGGKRIFLIGIAATSVMTLLTPFLTHRGIGFLITTRVLEGLFEVCTH